jgi:Transposase DDE domain
MADASLHWVYHNARSEAPAMQVEIITIYVICDEYLKAMSYQDDAQADMTTAEVMTTAIVAARFFKNCLEHARVFMKEEGYVPTMLCKSRLNRRVQTIPEQVWLGLFYTLAEVFKQLNASSDYVVDSLPIPICDNYRIKRCRLYDHLDDKRKVFRGYIASKRRFFYGLRAHVLVTADGQPVDVVLAPASDADISAFKRLHLDLPDGATIYADKAYTDYACEDVLNEDTTLTFVALRRRNDKRPLDGCVRFICHHVRKRIEVSFSRIADFFAKRIYAVTSRGVELKAFLAVLAFSFDCLTPSAR